MVKGYGWIFLIVIILACFVTACGANDKTYSEPDQTIKVNVNDEFIIALASNPTTGFAWEESHDQGMLSLEEVTYEQDERPEEMVGVGGTEFFRYKALQAGETEIALLYTRPWEAEDDQYNEQVTFRVEIK